MLGLRKSHFVRYFVLPLTVVMTMAACTKWSTQKLPVQEVIRRDPPSRIRVRRRDGSRIVLASPSILGDSLVGTATGDGWSAPLSIPLDEVSAVELRRTDAVGTLFVLAGVAGLVVALATSGNDTATRPRSSGGSIFGSGSDTEFSCPFVYSWDGETWRLDSGTFGGAIMEALERTDVDNLVAARSEAGIVRLRLANELRETDHVDELVLLAVDHPTGVSVAPDTRGGLRTLENLVSPTIALDGRGRDALGRVARTDGDVWQSSVTPRDTSRMSDVRDALYLTFPRPTGVERAKLVVDGNNTAWAALLMGKFVALHGRATESWYEAMNRNPSAARLLGAHLAQEAFLQVSVKTPHGWIPQGYVWEAGPEVIKRQVVDLDLGGVTGDSIEVRLDAPALFWSLDRVAVDYSSARTIQVHALEASSALMAGERDVRDLLSSADGSRLVLHTGDTVELEFTVPPVAAGYERSYLVRSTGWYRIEAEETGTPDHATLDRIASEVGAVARFSAARLNETLRGSARRGDR